MTYTGKIIVLAYPDTFVAHSTERISKLLPFFGLGSKTHIKAGHAALVLIENASGNAFYFDFGRYITPFGKGRVRGANTDAELQIPFQAKYHLDGSLANLSEFLIWLESHPEKTHGDGRLLASVCEAVNFQKALGYITDLQARGSIPYGAFVKHGSNCSRFVADTILAATSQRKINKALTRNKRFTPSTVGNVEKAASFKKVYLVYKNKISVFKGSALKENLINYFARPKQVTKIKTSVKMPSQAQCLNGIGSSAWFLLDVTVAMPLHYFKINRYSDDGQLDYEGVYFSTQFKADIPYKFTYDSHCAFCHVIQENTLLKLEGLGAYSSFKEGHLTQDALERKVAVNK